MLVMECDGEKNSTYYLYQRFLILLHIMHRRKERHQNANNGSLSSDHRGNSSLSFSIISMYYFVIRKKTFG